MASIYIRTNNLSVSSFKVTIKWLEIMYYLFQLLKAVYPGIMESDAYITALIYALCNF